MKIFVCPTGLQICSLQISDVGASMDVFFKNSPYSQQHFYVNTMKVKYSEFKVSSVMYYLSQKH